MKGGKITGLKLIGAKGSVTDQEKFVNEVMKYFEEKGIQGQVVDSKGVADRMHLELAFRQAQRRFDSERAISRSLSVEFLLYLAATHQINVALDRVGVSTGTEDMLFVLFSDEAEISLSHLFGMLQLTQQEPVFAQNVQSLLSLFGIPPEIGTDPEEARKAVYEAVSLVNLEK
jgi:tRNA threonylcarbamoyladenosine modification (KEOPS) complex Cgi121 subunit